MTELKLTEKLQIKLHTMICKYCKNYAPDANVVNQILSLLKEEDTTTSLSDKEKQSIKDALHKMGDS